MKPALALLSIEPRYPDCHPGLLGRVEAGEVGAVHEALRCFVAYLEVAIGEAGGPGVIPDHVEVVRRFLRLVCGDVEPTTSGCVWFRAGGLAWGCYGEQVTIREELPKKPPALGATVAEVAGLPIAHDCGRLPKSVEPWRAKVAYSEQRRHVAAMWQARGLRQRSRWRGGEFRGGPRVGETIDAAARRLTADGLKISDRKLDELRAAGRQVFP